MKIIGPQSTDPSWEEQNPSDYRCQPLDIGFAKDRLAELHTEQQGESGCPEGAFHANQKTES